MHKVGLVAVLCCVGLLVGCGRGARPIASNAPVAPAKPWRIVSLDPNATTPALLWNGLMGVRIGPSGAGIDRAGRPLPFFLIDEYDPQGEEKIQQLPNPLVVTWSLDGKDLSDAEYEAYSQELIFTTGELRTGYNVVLESGNRVFVKCSTYIHPTQRQIAQKWLVTTDREAPAELQTRISGWSNGSPKGQEFEAVHVISGAGTKARVRQALRTRADGLWSSLADGFEWKGTGPGFGGFTLERTVAVGLSGRLPDILAARGVEPDLKSKWDEPPQALTYDEIRKASTDSWAKRWETDIEIEGPVEDQQSVRSFLFYLRSAIHPDGDMSISPMGLSNQQYNGHVFWDADIWIFPALALVDPTAAREIADYRMKMKRAAETNHLEWLKAGRPIFGGKMGEKKLDSGWHLMYPWESSVSGKEVAPGTSKFQHHITGSVVFALNQAEDLGLIDGVMYLVRGASTFYLDRSTESKLREIEAVMSPDENHIGDNDLYTNILAQYMVDDALWKMPDEQLPQFKLPKDATSFLTYDDDAVRGYKQAAAVLSIYPLQYPEAEKQAADMMERFADKVTSNGPAMSESVHALIWARLGETDKGYDTWRRSWQDFTKHPLLLFSEKRRKEVTYFTTGAGGCLQTVIYGFLGFRLDNEKEPGAVWSKQLPRGRWLSIKPNLPKAWKSVKFKNFRVLGRPYTLTVTHQGAHVTEGDK